jgi:hypothetical protein
MQMALADVVVRAIVESGAAQDKTSRRGWLARPPLPKLGVICASRLTLGD